MSEKTSIDQFIWTRILAGCSIVLMYSVLTGSALFEATMTPGEVLWSKIMQNQLMWGIPCLLMITGALLLDPERELPLKELFLKYMRKLVVALVCFTLLFQILGYKMEGEESIWTGWLQDLLTGQGWTHMWYLYLMIGICLMIPVYRLVAAKADDKTMDYLLIVLIVFTAVVPCIEVAGVTIGFYIPTALVYPAYVFLGYRLYHRPLHPGVSAALLVGCTVILFALTWSRYATDAFAALEENPYSQPDTLFGYASIIVMGQAAGLFSLMNLIRGKAGMLARNFDQCTFGIYMLHMIGIHMIMQWFDFNPYWYGPFTYILMAAVLYLLSFGVTWVIRKIPKLDLL